MAQEFVGASNPQGGSIRETDQPMETRLAHGTTLHQEIISRLIARRQLSERVVSNRADDWNRVDEHLRMYIDLGRQAKKGDGSVNANKKEMPWERSIVVPLSYAIEQVHKTELMGIFMRQDPILKVMGVGSEDVEPAKMMQAVLGYDQEQMALPLQVFSGVGDSIRYGQGTFYVSFEKEMGWKHWSAPSKFQAILQAMKMPTQRRSWETLREYSLIHTVDPFLGWRDPRVSIADLQKGEFSGHRVYRGSMWIKERDKRNGGVYFNVDKISKVAAGGARQTSRGRGSFGRTINKFDISRFRMTGSVDELDHGFHAIDHLQVKLIPKEWKLGPGTLPEIWWFSWIDDQVIIRAHRTEYEHEKFTYAEAEAHPDPHVGENPGLIENLDGIQRFMNWIFNSHIQNVMRHLNNSMAYGPSFVEEADLFDRDAGGHFRLSQLGEQMLMEGRLSIDQMMHQMNLSDVTRPMLQDNQVLMDMALRMMAVSETSQARATTQRRTLGENKLIQAGAGKRMVLHAVLFDIMAFGPMARQLISNRQQFTEMEQFLRISGDLAREVGGMSMTVRPDDLHGNFDYVGRSAVMPPDAQDLPEVWDRIGAQLSQNPMLLQPRADGKMLDIHELFKEGVEATGVRNIESFYKDPSQIQQMPQAPPVTVLPDEEVARQQQAGDIIPANEAA